MLWIRQTEISFCYRYTLVISNKFVLYNEDVFHFVFIKKYLKQWIVMLIWNRFIYYGKINLIRRSHSFTHFEKRNKSWESNVTFLKLWKQSGTIAKKINITFLVCSACSKFIISYIAVTITITTFDLYSAFRDTVYWALLVLQCATPSVTRNIG